MPASSNITNGGSAGFIGRTDPRYAELPPNSAKHPAPIDPAGKATKHYPVETLANTDAYTVSKWFYISAGHVA